MIFCMNRTKNNHYVPRFYLKQFCDIDNKIWKLDKTNNNIYHPETLNSECSRKNLYTVKNKISKTEEDIIIKIFNLKNEMIIETLRHLVYFLNDEIGNLFSVKYSKNREIEKKINDILNKGLNNNGISRTQEILITELFEQRFIPIYEQIIRTNSIDFIEQKYDDEESLTFYSCINITKFVYIYLKRKLECLANAKIPNDIQTANITDNHFYNFVLFILLQELRTYNVIKQLQEAPALSKLKQYIDINNENFSFLSMIMLLLTFTEKLFFKDTAFKFILLKNETDISFITSDCPCVNIYSSFIKDRLLQEHEIEFLFPLSPNLSILVTDKTCYTTNNISIVQEKDIDIYNKTIINTAHRYVYSNSNNVLQRYILN